MSTNFEKELLQKARNVVLAVIMTAATAAEFCLTAAAGRHQYYGEWSCHPTQDCHYTRYFVHMVTLPKASSIHCVKPAENQFAVIASFRSVTQPDLIICNAKIIECDGEVLSRFNTTVERTFGSRKSSLLPE